jgi:hypothetical protein
MDIGKAILEVIDVNCRIWHEATKFKSIDNIRRDKEDTSLGERVRVAMKVRQLNSERSKARWEIDKNFSVGANESKVNYKEDKDA